MSFISSSFYFYVEGGNFVHVTTTKIRFSYFQLFNNCILHGLINWLPNHDWYKVSDRCHAIDSILIAEPYIWGKAGIEDYCRCWNWDNSNWFGSRNFVFRVSSAFKLSHFMPYICVYICWCSFPCFWLFSSISASRFNFFLYWSHFGYQAPMGGNCSNAGRQDWWLQREGTKFDVWFS